MMMMLPVCVDTRSNMHIKVITHPLPDTCLQLSTFHCCAKHKFTGHLDIPVMCGAELCLPPLLLIKFNEKSFSDREYLWPEIWNRLLIEHLHHLVSVRLNSSRQFIFRDPSFFWYSDTQPSLSHLYPQISNQGYVAGDSTSIIGSGDLQFCIISIVLPVGTQWFYVVICHYKFQECHFLPCLKVSCA